MDFRDRLRALFQPQALPARGGLSGPGFSGGSRFQGGGGKWRGKPATVWDRRNDPAAARQSSARLKGTTLAQDDAASKARRREGLLLLCAVNHPLLLDRHGEELMLLEIQ